MEVAAGLRDGTTQLPHPLFSGTHGLRAGRSCLPGDAPTADHPYAQTKVAVEQMLQALCRQSDWRVASLRYFNPVGAIPVVDPGRPPGSSQQPVPLHHPGGSRETLAPAHLRFGLPDADGTGIRDYLHVMDLAEAHSTTIHHLLKQDPSTHLTLNIGTGRGLSVLEVIRGFQATGLTIPFEVVERRPGDVPRLEACPDQAETTLGWRAKHSLLEMCRDGWSGSRPIRLAIALRHDQPGSFAAGWRRSQPCPAAETVGDAPRTRPKRAVILVNRASTALYSGMVPGLIAGLYRRDEVEINLRHLCDRAGAAFISAEIAGIDPSRRHCC